MKRNFDGDRVRDWDVIQMNDVAFTVHVQIVFGNKADKPINRMWCRTGRQFSTREKAEAWSAEKFGKRRGGLSSAVGY